MTPTESIREFCAATGLKFVADGEIGFGRKCVGILDPGADCYIAYRKYNKEFETESQHTVACEKAPENAYHKGEYLAVLVEGASEDSYDHAIRQLEGWICEIIAAGYEVHEFFETGTLAALVGGGRAKQKMIVDKT